MRSFRVCKDRTLTLPQGLKAGPGQTNMRLPAGACVTVDDDACQLHAKFVNGRIRAGDWEEIDPKNIPADAPEPVYVQSPDAPASNLGIELGTPRKG